MRLPGTIEISGTVDEESGGFAGVAWLARARAHRSAARTDYVIIPEPLNVDRICIGHRGVYWFEVTTRGRIGARQHAVSRRQRDRAAWARCSIGCATSCCRAGVAARPRCRWCRRARGTRRSTSTASSGGQPVDGIQTPCVADRCRAVFDRRFLIEEGFDATKAEIVELLDARRARRARRSATSCAT